MTHSLVVIVVQAFKGTMSAAEVAERASAGVIAAGADPAVIVASDGGDGLLDSLGGDLTQVVPVEVSDPLGRATTALIGWIDPGTAIVESRLACGLSLLDVSERDPLVTTTRGVGEMVLKAIDMGAQQVLVGLGGSATMDAGLGMARAWGWVPRDARAQVLDEGGGALLQLSRLDPGDPLGSRVIGLCDVRNPLIGDGGARVYAAQKGATRESEQQLAAGLERLVDVTRVMDGSRLAQQPGAGSAGGLGFGVLCFARGSLQRGADWVLRRAGFDALIRRAKLVVTGEGAFDRTSLYGKLTGVVMERAAAARIRVLLLAPTAERVPEGVWVESGGGVWSGGELERRAREGTVRALSGI